MKSCLSWPFLGVNLLGFAYVIGCSASFGLIAWLTFATIQLKSDE